jgi:hypothetical protein
VEVHRSTIFISYSHHDAAWLERLRQILTPLTHSGKLDIWDDTMISPGTLWQEEIETVLRRASAAVLLVTPRIPCLRLHLAEGTADAASGSQRERAENFLDCRQRLPLRGHAPKGLSGCQ